MTNSRYAGVSPVPASRRRPSTVAVASAIAVASYLGLIAVFWVGFLGSDDALYWKWAGGWMTHMPYLGTSHWALRHTLVIPIAIARRLLGNGMAAMMLPTVLFGIGLILLLGGWAARAAGPVAATAALALVVSNPQFVLLSSSANIDIVEMFFIVGAFVLLDRAIGNAAKGRSGGGHLHVLGLLVLAGISAGFGMLSRETTVFAGVAIGLLFLAGYGLRRADYLFIAAGFGVVVGLELVYLGIMSGHLLYRYTIAAHHDNTIDRWVPQGAAVPLLHPAIDPVTMLLLNHNFGLLTWVAVPLTVWLFRRSRLSASTRTLVVLAVTLALTWTVIAGEFWTMLPLTPRYFLLPSVLMSMVTGVGLGRMWFLGRRRLSILLGAGLVATNLLAMAVDNRNFMYGEHVLVDITDRVPGPIHTDAQTWRRAELLLEWKGVFERISPAPPHSGDLFYANPARAPQYATAPAGWTVVERHGLPETLGQRLARLFLPAHLVTSPLMDKLGRGHPDVTLYRLP